MGFKYQVSIQTRKLNSKKLRYIYVTLIRQDFWIWKSASWGNTAIITYGKQYQNLFGGRHRGTNGKVPNRCRNNNSKCEHLITDSFHCRTAFVRPWTAACNSCERFPYFCHHSYLSLHADYTLLQKNQKGTASLSSPSLFSFSVRTVVVHSTQPHIWSGYLTL